ncbi:MAG: hypothetical protein WAL95_19175 [Candidatus Acidiferrales bacterium]
MKKLAVYATLAVLAHAVTVIWHLFVLAKIPPGLTGRQVLSAAIAINVVPLVGVASLWARHPELASVLIFIPLAVGFSAGGFEHFLSNGPDNVFRMAATEGTVPFTISAVLLVALELCGCWLWSVSELATTRFIKGLFMQPIQASGTVEDAAIPSRLALLPDGGPRLVGT